jgi:hypothetical protein
MTETEKTLNKLVAELKRLNDNLEKVTGIYYGDTYESPCIRVNVLKD